MKNKDKHQEISQPKPARTRRVSLAPRRATSLEVARLAGVHHSTVSRVINNPEMVNDKTIQKVRQAIDALHYRPWTQARNLVTRRHEMIGLITDLPPHMSSHHVDLVEGVVEVLTEAKYAFTMASVSRKVSPVQLRELAIVRRHGCDGLLFNLESVGREILEISAQLDVPCVWINPAFSVPFDGVSPADQEIVETAVNYLISKGHRRIAYLNNVTSGHELSSRQRQAGYEMAMLRAKLEPMPLFDTKIEDEGIYEDVLAKATLDPNLYESILRDKGFEKRVYQETVRERIRNRLEFWLKSPTPPTAVVTYSDFLAVWVGRVAYREKWQIPETFSLVSCDDSTMLEAFPVPITAVKTNRRLCGQRGVAMLLEKIRTGASVPSVVVPGELVERESVRTV